MNGLTQHHTEGDPPVTTTATIEIHYRPNNTYVRFGCVICGGSTEKQDFLAEFADLDGDRHIACDQCATAGVERIRERFLANAERHERIAAELRRHVPVRFVLAVPHPKVYCWSCKTTDPSVLRPAGDRSHVCEDCSREEDRGSAPTLDCNGDCDGGHWGNDNLWHAAVRGSR